MSFLTNFIDLLYPNLCLVCSENLQQGESHLCLQCLHNIPKTNYHLHVDNAVEKLFWGKVPVERSTAYFFFQKGSPFQKVMHSLKYDNNTAIGEYIGKYAAHDLLEAPEFSTIDYIVPVPLHPEKLKLRGYNQCDYIAAGLSQVMEVPIESSVLKRIVENTSQTRKSIFERYQNAEGIFELNDLQTFENKHIMLIDDVITTGSTLEACIKVLQKTKGIKISVFALAMAVQK